MLCALVGLEFEVDVLRLKPAREEVPYYLVAGYETSLNELLQ
jgi:hypothetical protein